ncbi:MAG: glycyl-radical enzyme activating protein [Victivallales bacterium]|nr:glycyl-radical enzyme activating protein [Victivallales bacterium]
MTTALISNIERGSAVDGPGMRTVVFFKGCPLSCVWCHNPETISPYPELEWEEKRCMRCGLCFTEYPEYFSMNGKTLQMNDKRTLDFSCVEKCPGKALSVNGKTMTIRELFYTIKKDRMFYESFSGGVTFSGGEPLMQINALVEIAEHCSKEGIHTALDTTCFASWEILKQVIPFIKLFLCDLKLFNPEKHRKYTGVEPELIRENIQKIDQHGIPIWIRTPVISGINDDEENISSCAAFAASLKHLIRYELLPYNPLAEIKYVKQGH